MKRTVMTYNALAISAHPAAGSGTFGRQRCPKGARATWFEVGHIGQQLQFNCRNHLIQCIFLVYKFVKVSTAKYSQKLSGGLGVGGSNPLAPTN